MSYYSDSEEVREGSWWSTDDDFWDRDDEPETDREVMCHRCHGSGLVEVHGQDTDCIDCDGEGYVLI